VLQTQRLDMNAVVTQVQTMLAPVIGVQVRLTTSLDPDLPPVDADPGQMEQVLVNLALNARDAMPDGGTLLLETRTERVDQPYYQMPPGTYVCLAVSDTGVGMSPAVQAHIFEPFYTTKGSSGTGLGLSSVYGIVKQSGGFIWCRSEPGCGTTFTIYLLPARGDAPHTAAQDGQEPAATGAERLLVVDDEPGVRALMTRLLAARGYEVHAAEDGPSALAFLTGAAAGVDLVITDIVMPDMSGIRLAEEIESHWPGTPVLFVSGYAQNATHGPRRLAARGPVLNKPFTPTQIATAVREILDSAPPAAQRNS
jgi:CheY-like chemotaxis protein